jgi:hypothetical protein
VSIHPDPGALEPHSYRLSSGHAAEQALDLSDLTRHQSLFTYTPVPMVWAFGPAVRPTSTSGWQDSSGAPKPTTCGPSYRGLLYAEKGAANRQDLWYTCSKRADGSYAYAVLPSVHAGSSDPGCSALGDVWLDTGTTTTVEKHCLSVHGDLTWVPK